jgi:hypothetical protein
MDTSPTLDPSVSNLKLLGRGIASLPAKIRNRGNSVDELTPLSPEQSKNLILGAVERGRTSPPPRSSGMFSRNAAPNSAPEAVTQPVERRRAPSPFFRARRSREKARARDTSPEVGALGKEEDESDGESVGRRYRPQASAYEDESGTEAEDESDDEDGVEEIMFDEETEKNTEANAVFLEGDDMSVLDNFGEETEQDPLGEGPNVVEPSEPVFAVKKTKSGLDLVTSRPSYARDRCTITLTQGDPDEALEQSGKRLRRYVVLSDLSEESQYAVEWAIGTVARDGDEVFLISVDEDASKGESCLDELTIVDPKNWSEGDKAQKLKVQKEVSAGWIELTQRQTTSLLLSRQVTGLLQRTRLHVTVTCQALHAKNARHMLLGG